MRVSTNESNSGAEKAWYGFWVLSRRRIGPMLLLLLALTESMRATWLLPGNGLS